MNELLVFDVHKQQAKGKAWETDLENKLPSRSVFVTNFRVLTIHEYIERHLNRNGLKNSPTCPLCGNTIKKIDLDRKQSCQSLTDAVDSVNNGERRRKSSKLYWAATIKKGKTCR